MSSFPSLSSIQKSSADFSPPNKSSNGSKAALSITINADSELVDDECISTLRDDLPVEIFFCKENLFRPSTRFRVLKDCLVRKGSKFIQHPDTNNLSWEIANLFFEDTADREYTLHQLQALKTATRTTESQSSNPAPVVYTNQSSTSSKN